MVPAIQPNSALWARTEGSDDDWQAVRVKLPANISATAGFFIGLSSDFENLRPLRRSGEYQCLDTSWSIHQACADPDSAGSGTGQKLVLDYADHDLDDCTGDATANELSGQGGDIEPRRSIARCAAKQGAKQLTATHTANSAGNQIADLPEIGIL
jgi:hypothetical protein